MAIKKRKAAVKAKSKVASRRVIRKKAVKKAVKKAPRKVARATAKKARARVRVKRERVARQEPVAVYEIVKTEVYEEPVLVIDEQEADLGI